MLGSKQEGTMAKLVNLRSVKKARTRAGKRRIADANSVKFGLSKPEKTLISARARKLSEHLDAHKREE